MTTTLGFTFVEKYNSRYKKKLKSVTQRNPSLTRSMLSFPFIIVATRTKLLFISLLSCGLSHNIFFCSLVVFQKKKLGKSRIFSSENGNWTFNHVYVYVFGENLHRSDTVEVVVKNVFKLVWWVRSSFISLAYTSLVSLLARVGKKVYFTLLAG